MQYILYNPLANNSTGEKATHDYLEGKLTGETEYKDITKLDVKEFLGSLTADDRVILSGGDGTINNFVNDIDGIEPPCDIDYIPTGNGNDFMHDVGMDGDFIRLNKYIENLPTVTVNGMTKKFINGIGFGIDGYCCEEGDRQKKISTKKVNYTSIAINGLLFKFKPRSATVTIDGQELSYKKVWIAASMKGRYYGGGMMIAPGQDRSNAEGTVTLVVWHTTGRLGTLIRFPKVFKGEHVKYTKLIKFVTGKDITVKFNLPTALQIDGETVLNVTEYTVHA
ncbi:MAG: diacylglycerol kinase family protein [Clostridiales bacterium]|nr:diacylglycerol kinase family protein [Clostridiales bacterium]